MTAAAVLETEQRATILPPEQVKDAANLIRGSVRDILSSWEEYRKARMREAAGIIEFQRSPGAKGEEAWEVDDSGGYSAYRLLTSGTEWMITVQPGGIGSYKDPFISAWRKRRGDDGKDIIESDENSPAALDLAVKFVKQINGGKIPPALLQLSSSQNLPAPSYSK